MTPSSLLELRQGVPLSIRQIEEFTPIDNARMPEKIESLAFRDSSGRVRIEPSSSTGLVSLFDPVAKKILTLDLKTKEAKEWQVAPVVPLPGALETTSAMPKPTVLGNRTISGILFFGIRLEATSVSSASPVSMERWFSQEKGLIGAVYTLTSEYRYSAHFEDLNLSEPPSSLFVVPNDFSIQHMEATRKQNGR